MCTYFFGPLVAIGGQAMPPRLPICAAREGAHAPNKCLGMRPVAKHPTKGAQQVLRHAPSGQAPNKCQVGELA
jgi:hypothetical protein